LALLASPVPGGRKTCHRFVYVATPKHIGLPKFGRPKWNDWCRVNTRGRGDWCGAVALVLGALCHGCSVKDRMFANDESLPGAFRIISACKISDLDLVSKIARQADINAAYQDLTPLMYAAREGNLGCAHWLLELGADPNRKVYGTTALLFSTSYNPREITLLLLKNNANPNVHPDAYPSSSQSLGLSNSPLTAAKAAHDEALVRALLAAGANPE
jgi:hypothetical protein